MASSKSLTLARGRSKVARMRISYGYGGWVGVEGVDLPGPLYVRLAPDASKRWRVHELYIEGGAPLTADMLRRLPLHLIETLAQEDSDRLAVRAKIAGPDLGLLAAHYATSWGSQARHWVADSWRAQIRDSGVERPPRPRPRRRPAAPKREPLSAPNRLDDDFLRRVADAYRDVAARGGWPAPVLAAEAGVSPSTVRRWVLEARKRGHLPPGSQGRVG
jgi:hypothetical protein